MQLINDSPFVANVQIADPGVPGPYYGAAIVKSTFDLVGSTLRISAEPQPLVLDQLETPFGMFHGELYLKKRGIDFAVLGTVRRSHPVRQSQIRLQIGPRFHAIRVTGDRAWIPSTVRKGLEPSNPLLFTEMPLGYHRAFGGTALYNGLPVGYPDNPIGTGYVLDEEQAEGSRLPNFEAADGPFLAHWAQKTPVVGWGPYPMFWGLRGAKNVRVHPREPIIEDVSPGLFNHAHPDLVVDALADGTPINVEGLHPEPLRFKIPPPPAVVEFQLGEQMRTLPAPIDGVFLWADVSKVVVTQRARFSYLFSPETIRRIKVYKSE